MCEHTNVAKCFVTLPAEKGKTITANNTLEDTSVPQHLFPLDQNKDNYCMNTVMNMLRMRHFKKPYLVGNIPL